MLGPIRVEPEALNQYLAKDRGFTSRGGQMHCAYRPLAQSLTTVFVWAVCSEMATIDGQLVEGSGMSLPAAFTIDVDKGKARIVRVEVPADGNGHGESIRRIFPSSTWEAIFSNEQASAGLESWLRRQAADRHSTAPLEDAGRKLVSFLQGKGGFDALELSDTVTLYVSPEGGGGRARFARMQLRNPSAWVVRSGQRDVVFAPSDHEAKVTTKVGRHLNCHEQALADKFPQLASLPHVGTMLEAAKPLSCLERWNVTFVFDRSPRPRLVAAVYDQWEW